MGGNEIAYKALGPAYAAAGQRFGLDPRVCEDVAASYRKHFRQRHGRAWNDPVPPVAGQQQEDEP
jgi:hypothetical protein